jgi:hypothetical protein
MATHVVNDDFDLIARGATCAKLQNVRVRTITPEIFGRIDKSPVVQPLMTVLRHFDPPFRSGAFCRIVSTSAGPTPAVQTR